MSAPEFNIKKESEKIKNEVSSPYIEQKAGQIMKKMGFKLGSGLGKNEQGVTQAIYITPKVGRCGFGFAPVDWDCAPVDWDCAQDEEVINVTESIDWLEKVRSPEINFEKLQLFLKVGNPAEITTNSYDFCERELLDEIVEAKAIFEQFDVELINEARSRANPFETILSVFFINRSAIKLANIDAVTNFMFSNVDDDINHCESKGPFYFADVCAGPGGFSEYIMWRKSWHFKGFGLTLRNENDFRLCSSCCISPHSFQALYGSEKDGNICCPDNIEDFKNKVLHHTYGKGVHFMTSDGGFCVDGNENSQEILSKNIYLCQCLVALEIIRTHGHFVTKFFDVFTRFSVGLIYLMYKCFRKVSILKPNSSRPANAERYLICCDLQDGSYVEDIRNYLHSISKKLWELKNQEQIDVLEIVPLEVMKNDLEFFNYVVESNNRLGTSQIMALKKLDAFCRDPTLRDPRQDKLRRKCLKYWNIPDISKKMWQKSRKDKEVDDFFATYINESELFNSKQNVSVWTIKDDPQDWYCCALYSSSTKNACNFYAGFSHKTCKWQNDGWVKVKNLSLPRDTLLYGEMVKEQCVNLDENGVSQARYSLHIIDAIYLEKASLKNRTFQERMDLISVYAESINQEFEEKRIRIRKKPMCSLSSINFGKFLTMYEDLYYTVLPTIGYNSEEETHNVNSIMFFNDRNGQLPQSDFMWAQLYLDQIEDVAVFNILTNDLETNTHKKIKNNE